jgi:hypothetical protein
MRFPTLTPELCATLARETFGKPGWRKRKSFAGLDKEICRSLIGTSFDVCSELWNMINPSTKQELKGAHPKHLFWALLFLKSYGTVPILTRVVGGPDDKTFRGWSWTFVGEISALKPKVVRPFCRFAVRTCFLFSMSLIPISYFTDCFPEPVSWMGWPRDLFDIS